MNHDAYGFATESPTTDLGFEIDPLFELNLADEEWEEERRGGGRRGGGQRSARPRAAGARIGRRPSRPPKWPPRHPGRPPRRPGWFGLGLSSSSQVTESPPAGDEYVRWVQNTLNQVLDLRLPVDGVMGPATRSAIRSFQERQGLPVDGIVGPDTERALLAARRGDQPEPAEDAEFLPMLFAVDAEENEINRSSAEYLRWVQHSLNRLLGLRLAVDGISGPQTRSAVRTFQQQQGLVVDGIVGPQTEVALIAAGAGNPPGAQPSLPSPSTSSNGQALRNRIVQIARQEWQRWGQGTVDEAENSIRPVLADYWRTGVGFLPSQSNWWSSVAWSGAFISWVMRQAGAGSDFRYSSAHTDYVGAAKQNRLANNSNPFKAYRINEVAPRPGDLVCKERSNSGVTYDNVDQGFRSSHCDIVVAVQPGQLTTIGGNLSDSVRQTSVSIAANGRVSAPGYYAVVRVGE
jgi:peptidoglycan hydrolase-like protein with peptidoglycan-binding domain